MKNLGFAFILLVTIPLSAAAAKLNAADVKLTEPLRVGSVDLPPGEYRLIWNSAGGNVQITWLEHYFKVVASNRGSVVAADNSPTVGRQRDWFWIETRQHGKFMVLRAIHLPKVNLIFDEDQTSSR